VYHESVRTTLHLDDEAYRFALRHARRRRIGLGKAVSELVLRASQAQMPTKTVDGLLIFDPPEDLPQITAREVYQLLEQEGE
jgi:hypothetical protein